MKTFKFIIFNIIIFMWLFLWNIFAITIDVPNDHWNKDIIVLWSSQITSGEKEIFEIIQIINQYLWFSVWLVCMIILIIGGIKLISAGWDASKTKKANVIIWSSVIWLLISIFSYAAVRIIVNLF